VERQIEANLALPKVCLEGNRVVYPDNKRTVMSKIECSGCISKGQPSIHMSFVTVYH